jgi:digeranylgeranylglycerophospholipid reductase
MSFDSDFFDVVIIGGSIAGNYLAYLLSRFQLKILIIEEHSEIGLPLQCAGIISKKLNHLINLPSNLILNRVKIANLVSPSGSAIQLSGDEEPYIIDRIGLDKYFYNKIRANKKIKYLLGEKFQSFNYVIEYDKKNIEIKTSSNVFKAKILVGCDGPVSSVAKGFHQSNDLLYASQIRIKAEFPENEVMLYFHPYWKELFGWIVPEGNNLYKIGVATKSNIAKAFKIFTKLISVNLKDAIDRQGGLIPYGTMQKCAFENVLLLGDAACQVKATTGGGIVMLLTAAKVAANCIKKCFEKQEFSKKLIKKQYEKPAKSLIGNQLKLHYIIRKILEALTPTEFDFLFRIIKSNRIEKLISLYGDMDFPRELAFKILRSFLFQKFLFKFSIKHPLLIIQIIKIYFFQ